MVSVQTKVNCPLCSGECVEDFDCNTQYASYHCQGCGYASNTEVEERNLRKYVPKNLMDFVKEAAFQDGDEAVITGELPWWPAGVVMAGSFSVMPVNIKGKLRWRRREIEEIPGAERHKYPMQSGGGYYRFIDSEVHADFESYAEAFNAEKEDVTALYFLQVSRRHAPVVKLLHKRTD